MRELKFRAFDAENKTWTFATLGDLICGACTKNGDKPLSGAEQVWEQYAGLKDKNGKEIYEGDIVKINGWWDAAGPAGYGKNLCAIKWDEEITGFAPFNNYDCDCSVYHYAEDCEVIGNIHENHELLEEE